MIIYVILHTSDIIMLNIEHYDTIHKIKKLIEIETGLSVDKQKLSLYGKHLENDFILEDYNIKNMDDIYIELSIIEPTIDDTTETRHVLFRTLDGKNIPMEVKNTETIGSIKSRIYEKEGMTMSRQKIFLKKS